MRDREHHRRSQACGGFETRKLFHFDSKADAALLDAIYDWGLGLATNQGFGWIR
ncbi:MULTISPECIES: CRISPR-associated endoribonuclease Cas6 [unclassified Frankia]